MHCHADRLYLQVKHFNCHHQVPLKVWKTCQVSVKGNTWLFFKSIVKVGLEVAKDEYLVKIYFVKYYKHTHKNILSIWLCEVKSGCGFRINPSAGTRTWKHLPSALWRAQSNKYTATPMSDWPMSGWHWLKPFWKIAQITKCI